MSENRNPVYLTVATGALLGSLAVSRRNLKNVKLPLFCSLGSVAGISTLTYAYLYNRSFDGTVAAVWTPLDSLRRYPLLLNAGISHCDAPKECNLQNFSIAHPPSALEKAEKAVVDVTSSSFERLVLRNEKDVLVVFYAPWCGYCKRLVPIWDALADEMKPHEHVVIAQIDMTQNSLQVPGTVIQGYPTIYLFKKGSKGAPVEYRGARDVESFKAFLHRHA